MGDTIVIETPVATVLEVTGLQGPQGPTGPQGPAGDVSGSVAWSNVTGKPSTFTPSAHTHTASEVTDFNSAVVAAAPPTTNASLLTSGTLADARLSAAVTTSLGKADTASQPGHTHAVADVTGLQAALDAKQASGSYAAASHTHTPSEVGLGNVSNTAQVTSVSGTAPIVSSGGTTPTISVTTGTTAGTVAAGDHTHTNFSSLRIDPANGNVGSLVVGSTTSGQNNYVTIDNKIRLLSPSNSFVASFDSAALSADRSISLPNASGTLMLNNIGSTSGLPLVTTTAGAITTLALGSANTVLKVNSGGTAVEFGAAAGGVTSGSVDNAIIRADGTGGSTVQSSDINIEDATTSTANNVTISNQHSGQTNSALVLAPKGNGALLGQKPNGAASGGNSRGNFATDFQRERATNSRVASGNYSVICGGFNNSATNQYSFVGSGDGNQATGTRSSIITGDGNTASGERSFIGAGNGCTASGAYSAILSGNAAVADRTGLHVHASGRFGGVNGSAQRIHGVYFGTTTTNTAVTIVNLSVPASKVIAAIINIVGVKSDGSASAHFVRRYSVKNSGGTTSEVYAAETIGTDVAASTSVALSASDANDQLVVECTGIASETWRWVASVDAVEVSWAT